MAVSAFYHSKQSKCQSASHNIIIYSQSGSSQSRGEHGGSWVLKSAGMSTADVRRCLTFRWWMDWQKEGTESAGRNKFCTQDTYLSNGGICIVDPRTMPTQFRPKHRPIESDTQSMRFFSKVSTFDENLSPDLVAIFFIRYLSSYWLKKDLAWLANCLPGRPYYL